MQNENWANKGFPADREQRVGFEMLDGSNEVSRRSAVHQNGS
jgi:hypothetical protein